MSIFETGNGEQTAESIAELCRPSNMVWCDGSAREEFALVEKLEAEKEFIRLSWPKNSYLHRSHPDDVARMEDVTFICTRNPEDAGPTNNHLSPALAKEKARFVFKDAMQGRTMYVVPAVMGPLQSPYTRVGMQITDSAYVALNICRLYRAQGIDKITSQNNLFFGVHTLGALDSGKRMVAHFPEENLVLSMNSGFGGNSILFKKCFSLRLASYQAYKEKTWFAEHMAIFGVKDPKGRITYFAAAFPSGCGKTNLAMLSDSVLPGYEISTVSDDLCWMHIGEDGRLWAINPENGFFAIAKDANPRLVRAMENGNAVFTNTALTKENKPWWSGCGIEPEGLVDWQGRLWRNELGPASHPNSRVTLRAQNCPGISPLLDDINGVPISGIILGGRRADTIPLVMEARSWREGVFWGASMMSETTAAAAGQVGVLRHDPFAMMPFCGYNMADYFSHWLNIGKKLKHPPAIFRINWFLKSLDNSFLWRGYGENIRVLEWMIRRIRNETSAHETPLGLMPRIIDSIYDGDRDKQLMRALRKIDSPRWREQSEQIRLFFRKFGNRFPTALWEELKNLEIALERKTIYFE